MSVGPIRTPRGRRRASFACVGALAALLLVLPASANRPAPRALRFDVFLDERPIGEQRFDLSPTRDGLRVETRATFEVRLLRIKAFAYDHRNVEEWRGDCLASIASETETNGRRERVVGRASPAGFDVTGRDGAQRLDACVGSFAYWDKRRLLRRTKLLNSQTGEYMDVTARALGPGTLELGGRPLAVERWVLEGDGLAITLAYARDGGEWVALDSRLRGGFTLRYRRDPAELAPPASDPG